MSTLKLVEIKELPAGEITDQLKKSQLELIDLRMKLVTRQLEDTSLLKKKRKEIARLLTVQSEVKSQAKTKKTIKTMVKPAKKKTDKKMVAKEGKK